MRERPTLLPTAGTSCPWWPDQAPALGEPLRGARALDCAIVGAGYTGLACARRLAELRPSWRIGVLEALRVGEGSSGRNSGYVMDTVHWQPAQGLETHRNFTTLSRHGVERLRELVQRHAIECAWHEGGRYHVSVNRRGAKALQAFGECLKAQGEPFTRVSADVLAEQLGTAHYAEGLHLRGGALVEPARLVRGLAANLPPSVQLYERSPVTRIEPGPPRRLHTEHGHVDTRRLVLATNGFSRAWGVAEGRVMPLVTFASTTAPLPAPPGRLAQWGVVPEERMGSSVRLTADRRILVRRGVVFRSRPELGGPLLSRMAALHRASVDARFPSLRDVPITHTWGGVLGVTMNHGTLFGELGRGEAGFGELGTEAWVCAGHNGVGIALGTGLGDLLAHAMAGEPHPLLDRALALPRPSRLPPQPLLGVGVRSYTRVLDMLAGAER